VVQFPVSKFDEFANKKILGVKALYLVGGFVVILAVVAWKLKPVSAPSDTTTTDTTSGGTGAAPTPNPYDSLNPDGDGTVTVSQLGTTPDASTVVYTNDQWAKDGSVWLSTQQSLNVQGPAAYNALNKYLTGQDRTFEEQTWVDAWYKQKGPPPEGVSEGGSVGTKPGDRQISTLPGYHTVTGSGDTTYGAIANIYYGHDDQATYDLIQAANVNTLGDAGPFVKGTKIFVPVYHTPKMYTLPGNMTRKHIAAVNGISEAQFIALNNTTKSGWSKGQTVRVA
jgi:hypothetical protein